MRASADNNTQDVELAALVDQFTETLRRGERVHWSTVARQYPVHAEQLLRIGPSLEVLNHLAHDPPDAAETSAPSSRPTQQLPVETLGDFRIVRELGRGGMGVVFEAEQISVGRKVALKVLPFASMFDDQALRRFQNEVRAAAGLEHPHITAIFTVGEDRGVHFYAMQLIRGQSLAQLLTQLRSAPQDRNESAALATPDSLASPQHETRAGLSQSTLPSRRAADHFRWIAELMMQAAEALHYAHGQAIVHRDIKPANLLLDRRGKLWVTDFGLARTAQSDGITMTGDVVGTLRYMSPEQSQAKHTAVDHRTDIYSLGATLYELLTLQPPFAGRDREELLRQIATEEPIPPRRLCPAVPHDLQTIVLKALEKDASDRYETAQALAADLQRFVQHQPIAAKRPSSLARLTKWSRRNRATVTASLLTLVATLTISVALLWRAHQRTTHALAIADANLQKASAVVDDMYVQVAEKWLKDQPHVTKIQAEFLNKAADFYAALPASDQLDAPTRRQLALVQHRLGLIRHSLGQESESLAARRRAVELYESLIGHPSATWQDAVALADCLNEFGGQHIYFMFSQQTADEQVDAARGAFGRARDLLLPLTRSLPANAKVQAVLVDTYAGLAWTYYQMRDHSRAEPWFRQCVDLADAMLTADPTNVELQLDLANFLIGYGRVLDRLQRGPEREAVVRRAIGLSEDALANHPELSRCHRELAQSLMELELVFQHSDRPTCISLLERAIKSIDHLIDLYPDVQQYREYAVIVHLNLRSHYSDQSTYNLDQIASNAKKRAEMLRVIRDQFPQCDIDANVELVDEWIFLGQTLEKAGRIEEGRQAFREALAAQELRLAAVQRECDAAPTDLAKRAKLFLTLSVAASLSQSSGETVKATEFRKQAIANSANLPREAKISRWNEGFFLANGLSQLGRVKEAIAWYGWCAEVDARSRPFALVSRAEQYQRLGQGRQSRQDYWDALRQFPPPHVLATDAFVRRARTHALYRFGNYSRIATLAAQASEFSNEEEAWLVAMAHWKLGQFDEARRWFALRGKKPGDAMESSPFQWFAKACSLGMPTLTVPADESEQDFAPGEGKIVVRDPQAMFELLVLSIVGEIDQATVTADAFGVTLNGQPLVGGTDYHFTFNSASSRVTIQPSTAFGSGEYRVLINHGASRVRYTDGSELAPAEISIDVVPELPGVRTIARDTSTTGDGEWTTRPLQRSRPWIEFGADWKYLDNGSDQAATAWRSPDFDDANWRVGPAPLGYGNGDERTVIGWGPDAEHKAATTFFRLAFDRPDSQEASSVRLGILFDDSVAVYVNGQAVARENLSANADYDDFALERGAERDYVEHTIDPRLVRPGRNVVAVEVHQCGPDSTDVAFDLGLTAMNVTRDTPVVRFDEIIGTDANQIPVGAAIRSAQLLISGPAQMPEIAVVHVAGQCLAEEVPVPAITSSTVGARQFDVTDSLRLWLAGQPNDGWAIVRTDDRDLDAGSLASLQARLVIHFVHESPIRSAALTSLTTSAYFADSCTTN